MKNSSFIPIIAKMDIIRYNDHVKSERPREDEAADSPEVLSVTDQILELQGDLRGRMEGLADPGTVWKMAQIEMSNEANNSKQRTFVRAILAGLALGKPHSELISVVEKWQRAGVGDQKLAVSIARILEDATHEDGEYQSKSISAAIQREVNRGHVPGIQPPGAGSQPARRRAA